MIEIFINEGQLAWDGERLSTKEEFDLADRSTGSIFEALEPKEGVLLEEGLFILDEDLDLISLQEFAEGRYADSVSHDSWHELIKKLQEINSAFADAVQKNGLGTNLKTSESNGVLFDFESGALFESLPKEWRDWIASDVPGRDEAYGICADWAMRFAAVVYSQIE